MSEKSIKRKKNIVKEKIDYYEQQPAPPDDGIGKNTKKYKDNIR